MNLLLTFYSSISTLHVAAFQSTFQIKQAYTTIVCASFSTLPQAHAFPNFSQVLQRSRRLRDN